jgi:hypothetical protein
MNTWPFDQAENVAAITTRGVLNHNLPILTVIHYSDDHSWAFLCGTMNEDSDGRVISMREALDSDSTLAEIADLKPGWIAWRSKVGSLWNRKENTNE